MTTKLEGMSMAQLVKLQLAVSRAMLSKLRQRQSVTKSHDDPTRALRQPNTITIKDAVINILQRAGEGGLTKFEIAKRVVSEEDYKTKTSGDRWVRSVYQGGILPLLRDGVINRIGQESEDSKYQVVI